MLVDTCIHVFVDNKKERTKSYTKCQLQPHNDNRKLFINEQKSNSSEITTKFTCRHILLSTTWQPTMQLCVCVCSWEHKLLLQVLVRNVLLGCLVPSESVLILC